MVSFEWHAMTGELSFTTAKMAAPLTLPEDYVAVAALQSIEESCPPDRAAQRGS
jgi:hypothetical protein